MGYTCSYCHYPVSVGLLHGVFEISVETRDGKMTNIDRCPRCGYPLISQSDLKFNEDNKYRREDERTAAI